VIYAGLPDAYNILMISIVKNAKDMDSLYRLGGEELEHVIQSLPPHINGYVS